MEMALFRHHAMDRHQKAPLVPAIHHAVLDLSDRQRVHEIFFLTFHVIRLERRVYFVPNLGKLKLVVFKTQPVKSSCFPLTLAALSTNQTAKMRAKAEAKKTV